MRIIHVANFSLNKYGAAFYATDRKISQGLIRNKHFVYDFSYRDVGRQESFSHSTKFSERIVNKKLIKAVDTIQPDLLLLGHSELINASTLGTIRQQYPTIKIALWYVDALFHRDKTRHLFQKAPYLDAIFATTGGPLLRELSTQRTIAAFIPNMVDQSIESYTSYRNTDWDQDLIFCGRDSDTDDRQQFIHEIRRSLDQEIRISFYGCFGNPPITGSSFFEPLADPKWASISVEITMLSYTPLTGSPSLPAAVC
jgi:hypothetical protein